MLRALTIAATGMNAQQTNVEVIANNLANINTTAFKRGKAEFADLLYQNEKNAVSGARGSDDAVPEGIEIGLGVRTVAVRSLHAQGALNATTNKYDLAIAGRGWFQVTAADGETLFTRAGSFSVNSEGLLVTQDGLTVGSGLSIPQNSSDVSISERGIVSVSLPGQTAPQVVGQITLSTFTNDSGLAQLGSNLFRQTAASGPPTALTPGDGGAGIIKQGYLEGANVDAIREVTELIAAQRSFEMNSKVIQAVDEMAAAVSKGLR